MVRALLILFAALTILPPQLSYAKIMDKIVAVVNDEVITQAEIDRVLYPLYLQYSQIYKTDEELYRQLDRSRMDILKQLVSDKLILGEARKFEITAEDREIEERIAQTRKDMEENGTTLEAAMKEQNINIADMKKRYKEQILIEKVIDRHVRMGIDVQPSEISNYYTSHIKDYAEPEKVAVYTIFIKLRSERTPLESRQLADDVKAMIDSGKDFTELARNYSEGPNRESGGDMSYVGRGELLKEIDQAIFSMQPGEVSDVLESPIGYHICKVYDKKEEKIIPLEKISQQVRSAIYRTKVQKKFEEWIDKLKTNAYIAIK